jgi:hypothetical protein
MGVKRPDCTPQGEAHNLRIFPHVRLSGHESPHPPPRASQIIVSRLDEISTPRKDRAVSSSDLDLAPTPRGGHTPTRAPTTPRMAAGGVDEQVQSQGRTLHVHGRSASPGRGDYMPDLHSSHSSSSRAAPKSPHHAGSAVNGERVMVHNEKGIVGGVEAGVPIEYEGAGGGGGGGGEGESVRPGRPATVLDGLRGHSASRPLPTLPPARPHSQSPQHSASSAPMSGATTPNGSRINPNSPGT